MVLKTKLQNKFSDLTSPTEYWFQQFRPYSPLYDEAFLRKSIQINPFHATGLFLHPLKTENFWFSDVFRGYRKRPCHEMG